MLTGFRAMHYHLKIVYYDTIVRLSQYTLGTKVHIMINDLHKTARIPLYVKMQFY